MNQSEYATKTFYQDKYNPFKQWEVVKLQGGYYLRQYIKGGQFGRGIKTSKRRIQEILSISINHGGTSLDKDIFNLDAITLELESSSEKIDVILQDVLEDYFSERDDLKKHYMFEISRIKAEIVSDYAYKANEGINTLRETVDKMWQREENRLKKQKPLNNHISN